MEKERVRTTERILNLTLEIIYLLTGENYIAFKLSKGLVASNMRKTQIPVIDPPFHTLKMNKKVQEVTSEIIELLTEEVPIRCQDITGCISMEEWEYLEGHKDLYKNIMMGNQPPLTSPDGSSYRNSPERSPSPLYSRDSPREHHELPQARPFYPRDSTQEHHEFPQACSLYSRDSSPERHENSQARSLYSGDSTQEGHEIPQAHPLYPRDSPPERHEILPACPLYSRDSPPERHEIPLACPLYSQDSTQEHHEILQDDQVSMEGNQTDCRPEVQEEAEETYVSGDEPCKEEIIPPEISTQTRATRSDVKTEEEEDLHVKIKEEEIPVEINTDGQMEDSDVAPNTPRENAIMPILHPELYTTDLSSIALTHEQSFTDPLLPITHHRDPRGGDMFPCSICGICFTRRAELLSHQRSHTVEKPYSCSECGKCFTQIGNLTVHMKAHTGGKPYSCSECGKSFCFISALTKHQRIHTGEKPYSCTECGRCFSQRANLIAHQRTHTGEKPYSCLECGKRFTRRGYVIEHQRTHVGNVLLKDRKLSHIK